MHPEGRTEGGEEGAADPKEASIDKTLLHYITPDARAHRLDLITLMRVAYRALAVILRFFRIFRYRGRARARHGEIFQISWKNISRSQTLGSLSRLRARYFFTFSFLRQKTFASGQVNDT